ALAQISRDAAVLPGRDALLEAVRSLHQTIDDRPFGNPDDITQAAQRLETAAQALLEDLASIRFHASDPPRLAAVLPSMPAPGLRFGSPGRLGPQIDSRRLAAEAPGQRPDRRADRRARYDAQARPVLEPRAKG